jgi:molecular chaperone DnaK (HSP70)
VTGGGSEAEQIIPAIGEKNEPYSLKLSKEKFEEICKKLMLCCQDPIKKAMGISEADISRVIVAGGASRMFFVVPMIQETLPNLDRKAIIKSINPQEVIASGLALYGRIKLGGTDRLGNRLEEAPVSQDNKPRGSFKRLMSVSRTLWSNIFKHLMSVLRTLWSKIRFKK